MPAKSQAQQKIFGIARAIQKGDMPASKAGPEARRIAKETTSKEADKFASTKRKGLPKKVSERASQVVHTLLEDEPTTRACAHCQKEGGIKPEPGTSHGICKRHWIEQMADVYGSREKAIQKAEQQDPSGFCDDLSKAA